MFSFSTMIFIRNDVEMEWEEKKRFFFSLLHNLREDVPPR